MDRTGFGCVDWFTFVHRLANNVQNTTQGRVTNWNGDWAAGVGDLCAAHETFGRVHRDAANSVFAQVLGYFQNQVLSIVVCVQSVQDFRQGIFELNVDNGADDLCHLTFCICHVTSPVLRALQRPR